MGRVTSDRHDPGSGSDAPTLLGGRATLEHACKKGTLPTLVPMVSVSEVSLLRYIFLYIISYNINFSLTRGTLW